MPTFQDNGGDSIEKAIVIRDAKSSFEGIAAEYDYLAMKFGARGKDWNLALQALINEKGKHYDQMNLDFPNGTKRTVFFDITSFFGKF